MLHLVQLFKLSGGRCLNLMDCVFGDICAEEHVPVCVCELARAHAHRRVTRDVCTHCDHIQRQQCCHLIGAL